MLASRRLWLSGSLLLVLVGSPLRAQQGHSEFIEAAVFTPDGTVVCTASDDRTVGVWEAATGKLLRLLSGHQNPVVALGMPPTGDRVVSLARYGEIKVWEIATGRCLLTFKAPGEGLALALAPSGRQIITEDGQGGLQAWDPMQGSKQATYPAPPHTTPPPLTWSLLVSPQCRYAVAGYDGGRIGVWDYATRQRLHDLPGLEDRPWALAVSADNRTLLAGYSIGAVAWDLETGQRRYQLPLEDAVLTLGLLPDGKHFVTGSNPVKLWELDTGRLVRDLLTLENQDCPWAFSPDCRQLAVSRQTEEGHILKVYPLEWDK
jgi:WD40 repeat protein